MDQKERLRSELAALGAQGRGLIKLARDDAAEFYSGYQDWYTKAVRVVQVLGPDRLVEFRSYYDGDPKRKDISVSTYCIRDFVRGIRPVHDALDDLRGKRSYDPRQIVMASVQTQGLILGSLSSRIDGIIAELETSIASGIQDAEMDSAERLKKVNLRAAGALAGVVLETHLQRVADSHQVAAAKKNPTIGDLNEPLKKAEIYDITVYRKIQLLADIRNICTHQKGKEPTPDQIGDMLNGVRSITKSVF
jgi:hypothetical protein